MKYLSLHIAATLCLWLAQSPLVRAAESSADAKQAGRAGEVFFELDGLNGFWGSPGVPDDAFKLLKDVQQKNPKAELKCFAFAPDGNWVFLFDGDGYYTSNVNLPVCKRLDLLQKENADIQCVAFAPAGGWTVLWKTNGSWTEGNVPDGAFKKIVEVGNGGGAYRSIAYGPNGSWVLLFDKTGVHYDVVPKDLAMVLDNAVKKRLVVHCVDFIGSDWICLTDNGWWTSNLSLPSAKFIDQNIKRGYSPKWIAVKPELGPHDYARWAQMIHSAFDGKLAGGYAFEVRDHGKIVAGGAEGWARAPREAQDTGVKWTLDKPMGVASVSKTITAVALLKLWEENQNNAHKFSIDDPFWPHIKNICPNAGADVKTVTIRNLLMQRSGFQKSGDYTTPHDLEKLLTLPLAHKPGTYYEYENNNFYAARLVLEQIGHVQYTPYVKEHVLAPMGITGMETHFQAEQPTCGYGKVAEKRPGFPFDWDATSTAGAAGWFGSVSDLGLFLEGLREHKVLSEPATAMMFKDALGWDQSEPCWMKNGGWFWDEGTGGRAGELHSVITHFPDDVDAVILVNCKPPVSVEELVVRAWSEAR